MRAGTATSCARSTASSTPLTLTSELVSSTSPCLSCCSAPCPWILTCCLTRRAVDRRVRQPREIQTLPRIQPQALAFGQTGDQRPRHSSLSQMPPPPTTGGIGMAGPPTVIVLPSTELPCGCQQRSAAAVTDRARARVACTVSSGHEQSANAPELELYEPSTLVVFELFCKGQQAREGGGDGPNPGWSSGRCGQSSARSEERGA